MIEEQEQSPAKTPNYRLRRKAAELSSGPPVAIAPEWNLTPAVCCPNRDLGVCDSSISIAAGGSRSGCGPQRQGASSVGAVSYRGGGPYRGAYHEPSPAPVQVEAQQHNSHHYRDHRRVQYKKSGGGAAGAMRNGEPIQVKASIVESPHPASLGGKGGVGLSNINQWSNARCAAVSG